jgi:hypothetical protein
VGCCTWVGLGVFRFWVPWFGSGVGAGGGTLVRGIVCVSGLCVVCGLCFLRGLDVCWVRSIVCLFVFWGFVRVIRSFVRAFSIVGGIVGNCISNRSGKKFFVYSLTNPLRVSPQCLRNAIPNSRLRSSPLLELRCCSPCAVRIGSRYWKKSVLFVSWKLYQCFIIHNTHIPHRYPSVAPSLVGCSWCG